MDTNIQNYITRSARLEWKPLIEKGVNTSGIYVKVLRYDESAQRAPAILLKFEPGAEYPYHNHPAGEDLFVMEGKVIIEGAELSAGDYLYTPPGFKHGVRSESGCVLMLFYPGRSRDIVNHLILALRKQWKDKKIISPVSFFLIVSYH